VEQNPSVPSLRRIALVALVATACADSPGTVDAGTSTAPPDATTTPDSGPTAPDAGTDAGVRFTVESARLIDPTRVEVAFSVPVAEPADPARYSILGVPLFTATHSRTATSVTLRTHPVIGAPGAVALTGVLSNDGQRLSGSTDVVVEGFGLAPLADERFTSATFEEVLGRGWEVVDDPRANSGGPSVWEVGNGVLRQLSNIYGGDRSGRESTRKFGTYFVYDTPISNTLVEATITNRDDDGFGLIARYRSPTEYYRFEWMSQGSLRRLGRVHPDGDRVIDVDMVPFEPAEAYHIRLSMVGRRISVFIDDELVLQGQDDKISEGRAGVFVWGSEDVVVHQIAVTRMPATSYPEPSTRPRPTAPVATHGTMIGELRAHSAQAWLRTSSEARVTLRYGATPEMLEAAPTVTTRAEDDFTARIDLDGLTPDTMYHYQAVIEDVARPTERNRTKSRTFTTFAAPDAEEAIDVVFYADVHQHRTAAYTAFDIIRSLQPDLLLSLGDVPYMDAEPVARTAVAYSLRHHWIRSAPAFQRLLSTIPIYAIWDDHEVLNDWDARVASSRVETAVRSWRNWSPAKVPANAPDRAIYRSVRLGALAELFMLDTRSQRSANNAADGPNKTMLGAEQRAWLLNGLSQSDANFKIVVSSVPLRFGTTNNDHWRGFANERTAIFDHIASEPVTGVMFIAGDQHWHAAHHHPEGINEYQASGISASVRTPPANQDPAVVFIATENGFGSLKIRGGSDPRVVVTLHGLDGSALFTESVR